MLAAIARGIGRTRFARQALWDGADLNAFKKRPTPRIVGGLLLILFSYLIGWPAVGALSALALAWDQAWIAVVGAPLVYGLSHLIFLLGMILAGSEYTRHFLRWALRRFLEKYHPSPLPAAPQSAAPDRAKLCRPGQSPSN